MISMTKTNKAGTTRLLTRRQKKLRITLLSYMFMFPALLILAVFVFYPTLAGLPLSLFNYSGVGTTKFVGLANFKRAIGDKDCWIAMKNSVSFVLIVPVIQLLSLMLAVLVNSRIRGITFFRVLFYVPVVTSMIAVSIIWGFLFDPDGLINGILMQIGWISSPIYFLADPKWAMPSLMFVTVWQGLGYYMMMYLAGLQSVPTDLVDAARIDGASRVAAFFRVTLPMMRPYIWVCSLFSVLSALGVFDVAFAMTKGGPDKATLVMNLYVYNKAFSNLEFGYATAIGLLMSIITTTLSVILMLYGRKGND